MTLPSCTTVIAIPGTFHSWRAASTYLSKSSTLFCATADAATARIRMVRVLIFFLVIALVHCSLGFESNQGVSDPHVEARPRAVDRRADCRTADRPPNN